MTPARRVRAPAPSAAKIGWLVLVACLAYAGQALAVQPLAHQSDLSQPAGLADKVGGKPDGAAALSSSGNGTAWCQANANVHWQTLLAPGRPVLSKPDVHTCSVMHLPVSFDPDSTYTRVGLQQEAVQTAVQLYQVLLLDCDAALWQLAGIQDAEHVCLANTAALRASCNQWMLTPPAEGQFASESCAPPGTAFGRYGDLAKRIFVLQAQWRISSDVTAAQPAVRLPDLTLTLGTEPAASTEGQYNAAAASQPALLGAFVGSGMYPPSSLSHNLQAFSVRQSELEGISTAKLACGKRCTYKPLGGMRPKPVNVVGYSFNTFDRAVAVAVEVKRGWAGRSAGPVLLKQIQWRQIKAAGGLVPLSQPFQLYPGDVVRWRCSYDTSDLGQRNMLTGGHSAASDSLQEQCTVTLHYWPRVDSMRGCTAATLDDALLGENMCSNEAQDLLVIAKEEQQQFPMRRMYNEHSFPKGAWMGGWKATHIVLQMAAVWALLWGSQTVLSSCTALGTWHRRFHQLAPGQQRNVSLYITHLVLDTVAVMSIFRPMLELWLGLSETTADVTSGIWCFTYLVACYALELTWRRSIDTMLAVHHIGTITIILLYAGEFTAHTYRVANTIIVLACFAVMEQPTYIALLLKRMLPAHNPLVVTATRVGFISWFALKGLSVVIAVKLFAEDWHLMPTWIRVNFALTWLVASVVQAWSGMIQYGIYKQVRRSYYKAVLARQQGRDKQVPELQECSDDERGALEDGDTTPLMGSDSSDEDCIAAVDDMDLAGDTGNVFSKYTGRFSDAAEAVLGADGSSGIEFELSPKNSGTGSTALHCNASSEGYVVLRSPASRSNGRQVRMKVAEQQVQLQQLHSIGESGCTASGSTARRQSCTTVQRRSKSGLLSLLECGIGFQDS